MEPWWRLRRDTYLPGRACTELNRLALHTPNLWGSCAIAVRPPRTELYERFGDQPLLLISAEGVISPFRSCRDKHSRTQRRGADP